MTCYSDTGLLVSLHTNDANTTAARSWMKRRGTPMPWTWLHDIEFRNAIRLQAFREQIGREEICAILHKQALGLDTGIYLPSTPAMSEVNRVAEALSDAYSAELGARSLDILHVAQALVLGMQNFLTFDKRQATLAKKAGLSVPKI